ncbi:MAG: lysylphosphatidylglycerol synthase domain-containing protein [Azospirillaceae bacterium]|nr:lysylphosphatidylglycerol synthase domain-containing protein [Azospirillaceae bacterium]
MMRWATLAGLIGLALATWLMIDHGWSAIAAALAAAGWGVVWASAFHVVPMALNARAWQLLVPVLRRPPSLGTFTWLVWVREAVNGLLPVARVGGEIVTARLLIKQGMRSAPAVASLVSDMTITIFTQFVFTLIGLAILLCYGDVQDLVLRVGVGAALAIPILVAMIMVQRIGFFGLFQRLVRAIAGERWAVLAGSGARFDSAIRLSYRRPGRVVVSFAWQLAGWTAASLEIWLACRFLGFPLSVVQAVLIESLIQAVASAAFVIPGALGVQEGGFLLLGGIVGMPPEIALALALCRRARDVMVFVPALVLWQAGEGRRLLAAR